MALSKDQGRIFLPVCAARFLWRPGSIPTAWHHGSRMHKSYIPSPHIKPVWARSPPGVAVRSLNLSLSEVLPDDDATRWSVNPLPKKSAFSGPQLSTVHLLGAAGVDRRRTGRCRVLVQVRTARLAVCSPGCPHPPKARSARTAVGRRDWGEGGTHSFVSSRPRSELRQAACEPSMQV